MVTDHDYNDDDGFNDCDNDNNNGYDDDDDVNDKDSHYHDDLSNDNIEQLPAPSIQHTEWAPW